MQQVTGKKSWKEPIVEKGKVINEAISTLTRSTWYISLLERIVGIWSCDLTQIRCPISGARCIQTRGWSYSSQPWGKSGGVLLKKPEHSARLEGVTEARNPNVTAPFYSEQTWSTGHLRLTKINSSSHRLGSHYVVYPSPPRYGRIFHCQEAEEGGQTLPQI